MLKKIIPDKTWTLFLDRDGVLNHRLTEDFVKEPGQFVWIDGVLESLRFLAEIFGRIVVVTNQQGVGKGLMKPETLEQIHKKLLFDVTNSGGRIDKIYFCPDPENSRSFFRKPMIGMGLQARRDFPEIDFRQSIMAGDTMSDMRFGKRLKMNTVLISSDPLPARQHPALVDLWFESLEAFASFIK
jgi:D-glycero-D-manno-heptose 1,7-bisphosphate phosphatase